MKAIGSAVTVSMEKAETHGVHGEADGGAGDSAVLRELTPTVDVELNR